MPGQIFPILLICLAGLLVAVMVTIRVGENAKARTFASNAADAGSLTTASYQAGAFNKLVDRNKPNANAGGDNFGYYMVKEEKYQYYKRMRYYFDEMFTRYKFFHELANYYLIGSSVGGFSLPNETSIAPIPAAPTDNADWYLYLTISYLQDAWDAAVYGNRCEKWEHMNTNGAVQTAIRAAQEKLWEAIKCVGAFHICATYEDKIARFFKENQLNNFCEAKFFMNGEDDEGGEGGAWKKSREAGQAYAFNNSAIMSMLPEGLGDDFNYQFGTGELFGGPTATYSWPDPGDPTKSCFLSVIVELPKIQEYQIKLTSQNFPRSHTLNSIPFPCDGLNILSIPISLDPFNVESSLNLYNDLIRVYNYLTTLRNDAQAIYAKSVDMYDCCQCVCDGAGEDCGGTCGVWPNEYSQTKQCTEARIDQLFQEAKTMTDTLRTKLGCVKQGLLEIKNNTSMTKITVPSLVLWNDEIWNLVWVTEYPMLPVTHCVGGMESAKGWYNVNADEPGMMIININDVTLGGVWEEWKTKCTVTASCAGSTTTNSSTSKFWGDGGGRGLNIGLFIDDYYPEIILTD
ncbi:MAG: hypothetical protein Q8N80_06300 [Candidatus Omnitrophota bacterium]|nr:hypothetical protein [Candidatus Omnitrophota bacterium]